LGRRLAPHKEGVVALRGYLENWDSLGWPLAVLAISVGIGILGYHLVFMVVSQMSKRTPTVLDDSFSKHCRGPLRVLFPLLAVALLLPSSGLSESTLETVKHWLSLGVIGSIAWLLVRGTNVLDDFILDRFKIDEKDNLKARRIYTQLQIFKKMAMFVVGLLAFATMLMTFDRVRQVGTTILASAGIVGIVVGLATQRTIGTIFAGLQIAITQPIRVDDVVVVENEWGRIEEITFTYVVVRIWDLRRLVLPITYFIEKPFQNWTRVSADILGTVFLRVDYTVPVQAVRQELYEILRNSNLWDGRTWGLQVTDATEHTLELRALMSARDASDAWNLRCHVREKLIEFLQKTYPQSLPRVRAEVLNHEEE
jgi:small-conductance mechanosensitive channel